MYEASVELDGVRPRGAPMRDAIAVVVAGSTILLVWEMILDFARTRTHVYGAK